ncbi:MAG: hypothetical protein ABIY55_22765 [Kofleriaceae bacterium]
MTRSGCVVLLRAMVIFVSLAACDKAADKGATNGSGVVATAPATGSPATPAAGSQAAPAAAPAAPAATPAAPAATPAAPAATPGATPTPPAAPAENPLKVGAAVDGQWTDGRWYPGKIGAINTDGTFRVNYSDGDVSRSLPASKVRLRHAGSAHSSGGGGGGSCRGGLTQCGGRCVDIHNDNHNCNSCGRMCPEACMGGSCVSNHYKYGN